MASGAEGGAGTSSNSQQLRKYSLVPLPDDFEPTKEEQALLSFYDTFKNYERQAKIIKDAAARAKLAAKEQEFQKQNNANNPAESSQKKKRKKKKSVAAAAAAENSDVSGGDESMNSDESMDEEEEKSSFDRREEKLQALREEVEAKMNAAAGKEGSEDALRQELLTAADDDEDGPSLKRKKIEPAQKSSLIASISNQVTPPHDFSKKLELSAMQGRKLFPTSLDELSWSPPDEGISPDHGALTLELENFDVTQAQNGIGNNTVAIKFMAPEESKRFSINIAGPDHNNFDSVLFHFNPRHFERGGQLVLNNKQEGMWGQAINVPLSTIPLIFGQTSCTLIIQVNGEGFDAFLDEKHIARLEHRRELASGNISLFLNFPATDDYNHAENWTVHKVWWGNKASMAKGDLTSVPGYKSFNSLHPRKLFISKLPKIHTDPEIDLRRAELERAFRKYGGDRGASVLVPKNATFAFIEFESARQADLALQDMATQYRINRARRTRHEALQEERAAAEATKLGKPKENADWD